MTTIDEDKIVEIYELLRIGSENCDRLVDYIRKNETLNYKEMENVIGLYRKEENKFNDMVKFIIEDLNIDY